MQRVNCARGFTLVELMVVVAIIALLAAMAIPQLLKFQLKSRRTEAVVVLAGAHKAQMSYMSSQDHFASAGCASLPGILNFCTTDLGQTVVINDLLGLPYIIASGSTAVTPHGYVYLWILNDDAHGYELQVNNHSLVANGGFDDVLVIGMRAEGNAALNCGPCGWQDGQPFLMMDDIQRVSNCPC